MEHVPAGLQEMGRIDRERRQGAEGQEIGFAVTGDDGEIVPGRGRNLLQIDEVVAQVHRAHGGIEDLPHRRDHVLAAERLAVVPDDVVAQAEREGELVRGDRPARRQRGLQRIFRVLARVGLGHGLEDLALQHPVDGQRGIGQLVEARGLLIEAHGQRPADSGDTPVDGGGKAAFLPVGVGVRRRARQQGGRRDLQAEKHRALPRKRGLRRSSRTGHPSSPGTEGQPFSSIHLAEC